MDLQKRELVSTIPEPFDHKIKYENYFGPIFVRVQLHMDNMRKNINYYKKAFNNPPCSQGKLCDPETLLVEGVEKTTV